MLSIMSRRGLRILRNSYSNRGLQGVGLDGYYLFNSIWRTILNKPIVNQDVTIPNSRRLDLLRTAEILAGRYEKEEATLADEWVPDGSDVVELGGGIGFITTVTAQTTHDIGTHVVLEINPDLVPVLRSVVNTNQLDTIVDHSAYSARTDSVSLKKATIFTQSTINESQASYGSIPAKSLSHLIDEYDLEEFTLIVDIEGAEQGLIDEGFETMVNHCPLVIMELHRSRLDDDIVRYLERVQTEYAIVADKDPVFVFERINQS